MNTLLTPIVFAAIAGVGYFMFRRAKAEGLIGKRDDKDAQ